MISSARLKISNPTGEPRNTRRFESPNRPLRIHGTNGLLTYMILVKTGHMNKWKCIDIPKTWILWDRNYISSLSTFGMGMVIFQKTTFHWDAPRMKRMQHAEPPSVSLTFLLKGMPGLVSNLNVCILFRSRSACICPWLIVGMIWAKQLLKC